MVCANLMELRLTLESVMSRLLQYVVSSNNVCSNLISSSPMGKPRRIHVDSTWILRRYVEDHISTNFHVISAYFFDVILIVEKSTSFPRTFFNVIYLVKICTLFLLTFIDIILMGKNSTSFLVNCKLMKTF